MNERLTRLRPSVDWLPLSGWPLDAAFTLLALWLVAGVTWDFGHHIDGFSFAEEGFATEPHLTFYSAFVAIACLLTAATVSNRRQGASWRSAVPVGYRYALLGAVLFALGGPMDYLWHGAFGAEQGMEALTSPTHLLLATGGTLFLSSPLRASWKRDVDDSLLEQLPMVCSAGFVGITVAAFALYGNPLFLEAGSGEVNEGHGVLAIAAFSALLVGLSLTLLRRFGLAPGAFTVLFTLVGLPFTWFEGFLFLPALVLTGVVADVLNRVLDPSPDRTLAFRLFAGTVPLVLFGGYFTTFATVGKLAWTTHVWAGSIAIAVLVGLLVSYLVQPYGGTATRPTSNPE